MTIRGVRLADAYRRRLWLVAAAAGAIWVAAYALVPDDGFRLNLYTTFGTAVAVLMVAGILVHRPEKIGPWVLLVLGIGLLSAGDVGWFVFQVTEGEAPFPSVLDIAYLSGYVVIAAGILWLFRGRLPGGDHSSLIDALILACGVGILVWIFLMAPSFADESLDAVGVGVAVAYPLMDVLLLGTLARVLFAPRPPGMAFPMLLGFLGLFMATDFIYGFLALSGTYDIGILDVGWIAGAFCLASATLHPSMASMAAPAPQAEPRLGLGRLALLAIACLLAPAAFVVQELRGEHADLGVVMGGWVILFVLVLTRLSLTVNSLRMTLRQRRRLEHELEYRALHDGLTGLANRHLFGERLDRAVRSGTGHVGVLFLDLDDFKAVNDTLGHDAGDEMLVHVAARLRGAIRPADLAARLGGDEFAILLADIADEAAAERVAERVLDGLREPVEIQGQKLVARASVGISAGLAGPAGPDASTLMRNADIAMYIAKSEGKHRHQLFRPTLHAEIVQRLGVRAELERAVEGGELILHYQPIHRLEDGSIAAAEALVRWMHPSRGLIGPAEFIPSAESTGLIIPLGRWVLDEAVRQASIWLRTFRRPIAVSVNLSAVQLEDPRFIGDVRDALARHAVPPQALVLEVTESRDLDHESVAGALDAIRSLGVGVAIDDFGTGYSSLASLARLSVDYLKIDRKFIDLIASDRREATIATAIVQLSRLLGIETVAEGIETHAQMARLRELGVPFGQGFLIDRPMPADAFFERVAAEQDGAEASAATDPAGIRELRPGWSPS